MRLTAPSILAAEQGMDYAAICKQAAKDEAERAAETKAALEAAGLAAVAAPAGGEGEGAAVQDTALNGAQVTSLIQIAESVAGGALPAESALAMVQAAFPAIGADVAGKIIGPLKDFKPAAPAAPKETPNG